MASVTPDPTIFVNVDGVGGYMRVAACTAAMVNADVLVALADSCVFNVRLDGVDLSACKVYNMGSSEPTEAGPTVGTLMHGPLTVHSSLPAGQEGGAAHVFLRVDTSAAARAAPAGGTSLSFRV